MKNQEPTLSNFKKINAKLWCPKCKALQAVSSQPTEAKQFELSCGHVLLSQQCCWMGV